MDEKTIERITKLALEAMQEQQSAKKGFLVPVGVSARHVHLTQEHVEALFGAGHVLHPKKTLMGGQFAAEECVTIVGLKLRAIENVRVLGPCRKQSQVEVSATDALRLGVKAPIRESGKLSGSAPIAIVGPCGAVYLQEGCIIDLGTACDVIGKSGSWFSYDGEKVAQGRERMREWLRANPDLAREILRNGALRLIGIVKDSDVHHLILYNKNCIYARVFTKFLRETGVPAHAAKKASSPSERRPFSGTRHTPHSSLHGRAR